MTRRPANSQWLRRAKNSRRSSGNSAAADEARTRRCDFTFCASRQAASLRP